MRNPKPSFNATYTTQCVMWLSEHKDTLHRLTLAEALEAFNKDKGINYARHSFRQCAKELGIKFKSAKGVTKRSTNLSRSIAKTLRILIEELERNLEHRFDIPETLREELNRICQHQPLN